MVWLNLFKNGLCYLPYFSAHPCSSWISKTRNHDCLWPFITNLCLRSLWSREGVKKITNWHKRTGKKLNFSDLQSICMFLWKIWLDQRGTIENFIRIFQTCRMKFVNFQNDATLMTSIGLRSLILHESLSIFCTFGLMKDQHLSHDMQET